MSQVPGPPDMHVYSISNSNVSWRIMARDLQLQSRHAPFRTSCTGTSRRRRRSQFLTNTDSSPSPGPGLGLGPSPSPNRPRPRQVPRETIDTAAVWFTGLLHRHRHRHSHGPERRLLSAELCNGSCLRVVDGAGHCGARVIRVVCDDGGRRGRRGAFATGTTWTTTTHRRVVG